MLDLGIKSTVKEWLNNAWENWVKQPIANRTIQMENQVSQTVNEYGAKAKQTAYQPFGYYQKQEAFYRGLFWIAIGLLIILWIISGN